MGVAPAKIISVVILSVEMALVSSPNIIIGTKKVNKQVLGKIGNFTVNRVYSNKKS